MKIQNFTILTVRLAAATLIVLLVSGDARAQRPQIVLDRDGGMIVLEPYAPNIVRVTLSLLKEPATSAPGYGFVASPSTEGWTRQQDAQGDVYRSQRLVVTVAANRPHKPLATELDIAKFFNGSAPPAHIVITTPTGKKLAEMTDWSMSVPNHKDGNAGVLYDKRPSDPPFYQVGATFVSPDDEHYYALGQNHEGFLDHRGRRIECWHNYTATAAPSICVPFLVTNKG
jgi:alpha-D-xyloside xylohydrolase